MRSLRSLLLMNLSAAVLATSIVSCDGLMTESADSPYARNMDGLIGCIQGIVVNGLTGARVNLNDAALLEGESGISVMVRGASLRGEVITHGLSSKETAGEYLVCNIPLDEAYPLAVRLAGYEAVEGEVMVASTAPSRSPNGQADIRKLAPTQVVNIRVYPLGVETSDLKIVVNSNGKAVEGALVDLTPTGENALHQDNFLAPRNVHALPMQVKTNASGVALFEKARLTLGGKYKYRVIPPTGGTEQTFAQGEVVVGLLAEAKTRDPYMINVSLQDPRPALAILAISTVSNDVNAEGMISVTFNRAIEIVPGTIENITAVLANATGAVLKPNNPGNNLVDQANLLVDGNRIVLTPNFLKAPNLDRERALAITYSGITVKPASAPGTAETMALNNLSVRFFNGVNMPPVAGALQLPVNSGNFQAAAIGADLAAPLIVQVLDQYGQPLRTSVPVTFTVTSGAGKVRAVGTTTEANSIQVATEANTGFAKVTWRMGTTVGAQTVEATLGDYAKVVFQANATERPGSLRADRGANQSGLAGTDLSVPVEVQLIDFQGKAIAKQVPVVFRVASGGGTVRANTGDTGGEYTTVVSDANGRAAIYWRLGMIAGTQQITATAEGVSVAVNANSTIQAKEFLKVAGDGQRAKVGTELQPVQVQVLNHLGAPFAQSVPVTFKIAGGAGQLRAARGDSPSASVVVNTDNQGRATIYWTLGTAAGKNSITVSNNLNLPALTFEAEATAN